MRSPAARPKSRFRRLERWGMGVLLGIVAFVIEKAVLRSIRKGRTTPRPVEPGEPIAKSRGGEVRG